jgi:hypothetical protein
MFPGEEKAWKSLSDSEPGDVCIKAHADYDRKTGLYRLKSFNWNIAVSPEHQEISCSGTGSEVLLQRLGYFSRLSILWYLVSAKDIPLTGTHIKPVNLRGGQLFFRGTHVLPLDKLAERYGYNCEGFLERGLKLGAEQVRKYGDASVRLFPLPRVPVILILWKGDDEFPPRSDILFDSSCEFQVPLDIIWSVAMMSILITM